ncbi:phospholipase B [Ephemerocybe angulata]|uniref:Lysophospholipase n=1 Tax=Ephemerocybe angulata TaxID=980116 RepID=A0A8H6MC37_9AGAR|nr:phospholipase B [Tulosesus angulatus]
MALLPRGVVCLILSYLALLASTQKLPQVLQEKVTDYAPFTNVDCPDLSTRPILRTWSAENQTLHPQEVEYVTNRMQNVLPRAWEEWLGDGSALGYKLADFQSNFPKVGIAIPGGGLRAAQYGAACLEALDARNDSSKAAGTGGLLQVASYMTGLSGGSWVTGSLFFNGWPTIQQLVFGDGDRQGWLLDIPFVTPDGINLFSEDNQHFFGSLLWSVMAKAQTGIDTSMVDPWARMISYHFLNQTTRANFLTNDSAHGAGQLWSDIPKLPSYRNFEVPFPMVVANARPSGSNATTALGIEATVYEITPLELASYDPALSAGVNLTFAGTRLIDGMPTNGSTCVVGFDQAGFVMGTSAGLFNQIFDFARSKITEFSKEDGAGILYVLSRLLRSVRTRADDVANWPSPFKGLKDGLFQDSKSEWLELIDGSSNGENVPYGPLFVKARGLDVIVTAENSADIVDLNWPNGSSLVVTKGRQDTILRLSHQRFPPIPQTAEDFIATGTNARPTFFGCDPPAPSDYPLVIYLPNAPPFNGDVPVTNSPTFQLQYGPKHTRKFFDQVHANLLAGFVPNTNDPDPNWGLCLQCAAIDRARSKVTPNIPRSDKCSACFKQYCYDPANPTSKSQLPNRKLEFVDPDPQGATRLGGFLSKNKFALIGGAVGLIAFIVALTLGLLWWKKRQNRAAQYKRVQEAPEWDATPLFIPHMPSAASAASSRANSMYEWNKSETGYKGL